MRQFGLIGKKLGHSFSQHYFRNKFQKEQIQDADYALFELSSIEEFPALLMNTPGLSGLNVTLPYKSAIIPYLNALDDAAKTIGAVNTIQLCPEGPKGWNTDIIGFRDTFVPLLQPHHKKALILGDGGASKAVQYVLRDLEIDFHVISRKGELKYAQMDKQMIENHPLIIQTTPVGMYPNIEETLPFDLDGIGKDHLVYDLIYNPEKTKFLTDAEYRGAIIKNGLEMLHLQAEGAWQIWNM